MEVKAIEVTRYEAHNGTRFIGQFNTITEAKVALLRTELGLEPSTTTNAVLTSVINNRSIVMSILAQSA